MCENNMSICRIALLLASTCDYKAYATGSPSRASQSDPDSSTSTALGGRGPTVGCGPSTTCGDQVAAVRQGGLGVRGTETCNSFFFFF